MQRHDALALDAIETLELMENNNGEVETLNWNIIIYINIYYHIETNLPVGHNVHGRDAV